MQKMVEADGALQMGRAGLASVPYVALKPVALALSV